MIIQKIKDDVYSVGVLNPNLRVFDVVMETKFGTSYNSYLVKGKEKTALIDTVHATYFNLFVENLEKVCDIQKIDYLIMNHNEPDHSGSIAKLMELNPNLVVFTSQAGSIYLKGITNIIDLNVKVVKDKETLDLGNKTLTFINAPFLHWPDSMFTWSDSDKILFSCDFLGCHYCEPGVFDTNIIYKQKYEYSLKYYYDAIFKPFNPYVINGLKKIEQIDMDFICPSHGPVLTKSNYLDYALENYKIWSKKEEKTVVQIPIFYCTAYGNTRLIAESIKTGILSVKPEANVELFDIIEFDIQVLTEKLNQCDAFLVGSPTINRDAVPPVMALLSHVDAISSQNKFAGAFGSYGWSGEGVPAVVGRLKQLRYKVIGEGLRINFVPSEEELKKAVAFGVEFADGMNL